MESVTGIQQIAWSLQPRDAVNPFLPARAQAVDAFEHCLTVINRCMGRFNYYKVGVTHLPWNRWRRFGWENRQPPLLCFMWVTENSSVTAALEKRMVSAFSSDHRFLNWREGGELAHIGTAPHFAYCAFYYSRSRPSA